MQMNCELLISLAKKKCKWRRMLGRLQERELLSSGDTFENLERERVPVVLR